MSRFCITTRVNYICLMNDYCIFQLYCHTVCFSKNNPHLQSTGFFTLHKFSHYTNHLPYTVQCLFLNYPIRTQSLTTQVLS